jgi:hypothetical protein
MRRGRQSRHGMLALVYGHLLSTPCLVKSAAYLVHELLALPVFTCNNATLTG